MDKKKLLVDYHLHTKRCGHASGEMQEFIDKALSLGLSEIGFSDHLPLLNLVDRTLAMSWDELPFYLADVAKVRDGNKDIKIKLGIEVDFLPRYRVQLANIIENYDFDYVLGSVHFLDGWGIDDRRDIFNYESYDIGDLYERYFTQLRLAAESGLFDILAHPDLIKKYNFKPEHSLTETYKKTAEVIAKAGIAIEVSSAGLRKPVKEIYPSQEFLNICAQAAIPITIGSDAHSPQDVGRDFQRLLDSLTTAGYDKIATYSQRQRTMLTIGDNGI